MQFQINKHCTEQWEEMADAANGRHCAKCCKTVIDFSTWEAGAIANYLRQNSGVEVCGRILEAQQNVSKSVRDTSRLPLLYRGSSLQNKVAAIVLLAIGFFSGGCKSKVDEEKANTADNNVTECDSILTPNNSYILGGIGTPNVKPDSMR